MTTSAVGRRRVERDERLAQARRWAHELGGRMPELVAAVVVGSVARGDFNRWSDLDVLVVVESLPDRWLARCEALAPLPPGLQPIAWTPDELTARRRRRDPITVEADTVGVTVWGSLPERPRAERELSVGTEEDGPRSGSSGAVGAEPPG